MKSLYSSPLRVYLSLGLLALFGIFSGNKLPISMFPQSSKPTVGVQVPYTNLTPEEFSKAYGAFIENRLQSLSDSQMKIASIETNYQADQAQFKIVFDWGTEQRRAVKEVEAAIYGMSGQFPKEMRDRLNVWTWSENQGFLAMSFYSEKRSVDELYEFLDPILTPMLANVRDTDQAGLWNPSRKEVQIELIPEAMAALQVLPREVGLAVEQATTAQSGGSLLINTTSQRIQMPRQAKSIDELKRIPILSRTGRATHLQDVAHVELRPSISGSRSFKTSGSPSLILFASPSPGGNIKAMSEDIIALVKEKKTGWPEDVQMKVLVDPSEFISNSIRNVFHEVILAAFLAVVILFLFIGSLRNVATAAIEIPLSIILAFILMWYWGININLISLGGLALSAGMNVDASVVVMENIFRHFELHKGPLSYHERLTILCRAVSEVRLPVIASTIASIVVFLPLAFTSALSYSILGDLAKTVVFSHGFSAIVALILVPTIRMQLMSLEERGTYRSPIEAWLRKMEQIYSWSLGEFLNRPRVQLAAYGSLAGVLLLLVFFALPRLPREVIGVPDTDWMVVGLSTQGNTLLRQMEDRTAEEESKLLKKFGDEISYTFTQVSSANNSNIMARLKDKSKMQETWKKYLEFFQNTPFVQYYVEPWNPSELPIPDPPHFQASVQGGTPRQRLEIAHQLHEVLESKKNLFSRSWQKPNYSAGEDLVISPHLDQWTPLIGAGVSLMPSDLTDISRIATQGRSLGPWALNNRMYDMILTYPQGTIQEPEDLRAFPLGIKNKIIPLGALAQIYSQEGDSPRFRKNQQDIVLLSAKQDKGNEDKPEEAVRTATSVLKEWIKQNKEAMGPVTVQFEDAQFELNDALNQLGWAVALSILLIFVTMVIQLGDIVSSLLVLVAIPLGFVGVILSLFVFQSTLSLNSVLGVILLNGISVANSIILVDFFNKLMQAGKGITESALEAAKARLRPILMTSLTTTIGMLPIAFGLGDGGRVLQPLGIAVSGGLWISMLFTLYFVPSLQVAYWKFRKNRLSVKGFALARIESPEAIQ